MSMIFFPRQKRSSPEHDQQKAFFRWVDIAVTPIYPEASKLIFAIPNGGHRDIRTAVKLKAEGVRSGVHDVFVSMPSKKFNANGLYIEFKAGKNDLTDQQKIFGAFANKHFYLTQTVYSWIDAARILMKYLDLNIEV